MNADFCHQNKKSDSLTGYFEVLKFERTNLKHNFKICSIINQLGQEEQVRFAEEERKRIAAEAARLEVLELALIISFVSHHTYLL